MQVGNARRGALVGLLALAMAGAATPGAGAAQVDQVGPNDYELEDLAGNEANVVTVTRSGRSVTFSDAGSDLTLGGGSPDCTEDAVADTITCTAPGAAFFEATARLAGGNDTATLVAPAEERNVFIYFARAQGGDGDDTLNGSVDGALLRGDGGNDTINGGDNPPYDGDNIDGNDGNDTLRGGAGSENFNVSDSIDGGAGDDTIDGGPGDDDIFGDPGNDTLAGGADDDSFFEGPGSGTDVLRGDAGLDDVQYSGTDFAPAPDVNVVVNVSLDGQPNDGSPGENDNAQVEDVFVSTNETNDVTNTITGDGGSNLLSGSGENDVIDGGGGNDTLSGNDGDDTLRARDGFADRVFCDLGNDTVTADTFDAIGGGCEAVDAQGSTFATEDKPPTITVTSPASGATLVTARPTPITVSASDDKGIARVVLIDDGQPVGESTTAPYTINYQPRGGDVGVNQLALVAVDSSGQTTTAFRTVRVNRFTPRSVSVGFSPTRDRTLPFRFTTRGSVNLPTSGLVTRAQGCKGVVSVQVKKGSRTISTRRANLSRTCTYSSTVVFRDTSRTGSSGTLKVTVRFLGNEVLARRSASARNYRIGR